MNLILKNKLLLIQLLTHIQHNLFKEDIKILHSHIYPLILINYNPSTNQIPVNTTQPVTHSHTQAVAIPFQNIPVQQDTFMNMSASIPEPMKPFDGLDHS